MNGRKYSYYVLLVLAAIFAITNIITYVQAGLDDSSAFTADWMMLLTGIFFILALVLMPKRSSIGWVCCLIGMLILTFQSLMGLMSSGAAGVTELCLDLFVVFYLLDDYILRMFGIKD